MSTQQDDNNPTGLPLAPTFSFSQSSLQAFEECQRRFWLAYVAQLPWPAVEAAPVRDHELLMRQGAQFHRLIERVEIGMETATAPESLLPPLDKWFAAYLRWRPDDLPTEQIEVERVLSIPFATQAGRYRLLAKYDLIAAEAGGRVVIVDWKSSRRRSDPATLRRRLQSVVYPFVLVEASRHLDWGPIRPEQVEMRYWFTADPHHPIIFAYDAEQHEANRRRLEGLLARILAGATEHDFPKILDTEENRRRTCSYCVYRSRCNRGVDAGDLDASDDAGDLFVVDLDTALEFTLDDVEELAF
ncbi:MAG: PD-(D/E)XK nuclease family protein [Caldilineaceae bacterium]|nr:PD-(D/E)XK nuclease family protein [Caldilineaceae bacterium]